MLSIRKAILQGGVPAMADTGVNEVLGNFFEILKISPGTVNLNKLHAMCLMPLFNDLLGGKMKDMALKDKSFWQKFMDRCFPNLGFSSDSTCANTTLYVGTADVFNDTIILNNSATYDISKSNRMISPRVTGTYFWIAVPAGFALSKANNLDFAGDCIPASGFKMEARTIRNGQYYLYWLKSRIPFKSTYQIILK